MFELGHLRCFVAVAEELHFGRAAARLNMTQPPLSRQVQILEHGLDIILLERTSRLVRLTPAGRAFLPEARRIIELAEGAGLAAKPGENNIGGARQSGVPCGIVQIFARVMERSGGEARGVINVVERTSIFRRDIFDCDVRPGAKLFNEFALVVKLRLTRFRHDGRNGEKAPVLLL